MHWLNSFKTVGADVVWTRIRRMVIAAPKYFGHPAESAREIEIMNLIISAVAFFVGFEARFFQLSMHLKSMAGLPSAFEPCGDVWCLLSSCVYGLICLLVVNAVRKNAQGTASTMVMLALAGILLLADFAKPSRFEDGTYLDHAIHTIGVVQANALNHDVTMAKELHSIAKL
jgi:hypothetical protein